MTQLLRLRLFQTRPTCHSKCIDQGRACSATMPSRKKQKLSQDDLSPRRRASQGSATPADLNDARIGALHRRIGPRAGVSDQDLRDWLEKHGWDVDRAFEQWRRDQIAARTTSQTPGADNNTAASQILRLRAAETIHQNHRLAINELYEMIRLQAPNEPGNRLTTLRLANLLNDNGWDIQGACHAYVAASGDFQQLARCERRL